MRKKEPIAILCADIHLSLKRPGCRLDDWMKAQADYLGQLRDLQEPPIGADGKQNVYKLPVLCAGDVFDRWNPAPELIHFALEHLPDKMICVPGQHDLPNHRVEEMHRSAYGVLVQAGKIVCADSYRRDPRFPLPRLLPIDGGVLVGGFGWNQEVTPVQPGMYGGTTIVALIHKFVWTVGTGYPGASESQHLNKLVKPLKGYNVAVFGDNHKPFSKKLKTDTLVFNCGGFIRRKIDELEHRPRVGILFSNGQVESHYLNTKQDKFADLAATEELKCDMRAFLEQLEQLGEHGLDFRVAVRRHVEDPENMIPASVRELVLSFISD